MQRIADGELSGIDEADDVPRVRELDRFALAAEEAVRARSPDRRAGAAVHHRHVLREPAGAHAHERDAIAVARIHVRLNLEDEPRETLVRRLDDAGVARPWLRRRRELYEGVQERLEAEIRERAAEKHRRLKPGAVRMSIERRSRSADDRKGIAEFGVHALADQLRSGGIIERHDVHRRAELPLGLALIE